MMLKLERCEYGFEVIKDDKVVAFSKDIDEAKELFNEIKEEMRENGEI